MMYKVEVGTPEARFGRALLEQFGGANGELAAALQYTVQAWGMDGDAPQKDMLLDIGTEEFSHLEVIGALAKMHLKPIKEKDREAMLQAPLIAMTGGGGLNLLNSMGNPWTADYLKIAGRPEIDLRNNIAAEARAKITYERLIEACDDPGTKDALMFLMTREITHMKAFMLAFESLGVGPLEVGQMPIDEQYVNLYFNDSSGHGEQGSDQRGPWNQGGDWDYREIEQTLKDRLGG